MHCSSRRMSSTQTSMSFWIFVTLFSSMISVSLSARLPDIYWNSSNPIFRIDNTDHIIDVNRGNVQYEYDQVNIMCPMYSKGTREDDIETYIIYNVSKEEYDTCRIANPAVARTIAVCDKPYVNRYYTITFRPFTPQPGGLEFRPGQDYYFISLSAGPSLSAGRCNSHHMKVVFKVCCKRGSLSTPSVRTTTTTTTTSTTTQKPVITSTTSRVLRIWTLSPPVNMSSNRAPLPDTIITPKRNLKDSKDFYNYSKFNNSIIISTTRPSLMASQPSSSKSGSIQSSTAPTPYWWRPHFTKMPSNKLNYEPQRPADEGYKKKEVRDKRPNDTREKSDGLNSGAVRSLMRTISVIITINLLLSWIRR
jgi:ephrin-B